MTTQMETERKQKGGLLRSLTSKLGLRTEVRAPQDKEKEAPAMEPPYKRTLAWLDALNEVHVPEEDVVVGWEEDPPASNEPSSSSPHASLHTATMARQSSRRTILPTLSLSATCSFGTQACTSPPGVPQPHQLVHSQSLESSRSWCWDDSLFIPWGEVEQGAILGHGGYGRVYKGRWQGHRVAIKTIESSEPRQLAKLRQEALIMSQLRHPCIARVFGLVDEPRRVAIVMQYYPRGSLAQFMQSKSYASVPPAARLCMAWQVATGMAFLHSRRLYHLDLKPANILIGLDGSVVIADFGLARHMARQEGEPSALTVSISPPEVLRDPHAPRGPAVDVYAFGICLLEVTTGAPAWGADRRRDDIRAAVCAGQHPHIPETLHPRVADAIMACLAHEPDARPHFVDVANWLSDVVRELEPDGDDFMLPGC